MVLHTISIIMYGSIEYNIIYVPPYRKSKERCCSNTKEASKQNTCKLYSLTVCVV